MEFKLKYGFNDQRFTYIYISDELDIKEVAKRIMKCEEALEYTVDDKISNDGKDYFNIHYTVDGCSWECQFHIEINYLIEINGKLFELPEWGLDHRAIIIKPKKAKTKG